MTTNKPRWCASTNRYGDINIWVSTTNHKGEPVTMRTMLPRIMVQTQAIQNTVVAGAIQNMTRHVAGVVGSHGQE